MARLFFALWPSTVNARRLAALAAGEAKRYGGRPTRAQTIHLTLAFVGNVDEQRVGELHAVASRVRGERFRLQLDRLDTWSHNHIRWAGSRRPCPALETLAVDLRRGLEMAGFPIEQNRHGFMPHVTLVRGMQAVPPVGGLAETLAEPSRWNVSAFVLVRSQPAGGGYDIVQRYRLDG